jgi:hypothetical protein
VLSLQAALFGLPSLNFTHQVNFNIKPGEEDNPSSSQEGRDVAYFSLFFSIIFYLVSLALLLILSLHMIFLYFLSCCFFLFLFPPSFLVLVINIFSLIYFKLLVYLILVSLVSNLFMDLADISNYFLLYLNMI